MMRLVLRLEFDKMHIYRIASQSSRITEGEHVEVNTKDRDGKISEGHMAGEHADLHDVVNLEV